MGVSLEDRIKALGPVLLVARRAKVSRSALYFAFERERETGEHNMDDATVKKIAAAFNKSEEWVRTGAEPEPPKVPDTLENARLVAKLLVAGYELTDRDAWLLLFDLKSDENTVDSLFRAALAKLRSAGVPAREPPSDTKRQSSRR